MRVWHAVALLLLPWLCCLFYTRGVVAGLQMAGHGDIVGWTWWIWFAPLTALVLWACVSMFRQERAS